MGDSLSYLDNLLSKRDSVRSTLAAVVLLQLKFSRPFTNFYGIQP